MTQNTMKQKITVPSKVTTSFFDLPCIRKAFKTLQGEVFFELRKDIVKGDKRTYIFPGDSIIEEDDGTWRTERKVFSEEDNER